MDYQIKKDLSLEDILKQLQQYDLNHNLEQVDAADSSTIQGGIMELTQTNAVSYKNIVESVIDTDF